jgi:hypothetical protein
MRSVGWSALTYRKVLVSLEYFYRSSLVWVKHVPVIDCSIRNQTQACFTEPLPKYDILIHCGRLQFGFLGKVEDLEGPRLCLQRDNLLGPVHDSTICFDRSFHYIVIVFEVNYDDFW